MVKRERVLSQQKSPTLNASQHFSSEVGKIQRQSTEVDTKSQQKSAEFNTSRRKSAEVNSLQQQKEQSE
jgi:hypothetical protein